MIENIQDPDLIKAVNEYYDWHGDSKPKIIKTVTNKDGYDMLLVHFIDVHGRGMSALMHYMRWGDGHYDVTEDYADERQYEEMIVKTFENDGSEWDET